MPRAYNTDQASRDLDIFAEYRNPRPMRVRKHEPEHNVASILILAIACGLTMGASALVVLKSEDLITWIIKAVAESHVWLVVPQIAMGAAGGLSWYLWKVTEGHPFKLAKAALLTFVGGFFGLLASKAAAGAGLNENLETAAAGIAGGMGPKSVDLLVDVVVNRRNGSK